jgi:hypothetical protein
MRLIGRKFSDNEVQKDIGHVPFRIVLRMNGNDWVVEEDSLKSRCLAGLHIPSFAGCETRKWWKCDLPRKFDLMLCRDPNSIFLVAFGVSYEFPSCARRWSLDPEGRVSCAMCV